MVDLQCSRANTQTHTGPNPRGRIIEYDPRPRAKFKFDPDWMAWRLQDPVLNDHLRYFDERGYVRFGNGAEGLPPGAAAPSSAV